MATAFDLGVTAWSPLAGGKLARGNDDRLTRTLQAVARELNATPMQVAIAWLRCRPGHVIPIIGTSKPEQMRENLGALDIHLPAEQLAELDKVSAVDLGFPGAFLNSEVVRDVIYGSQRAQVGDGM